MGLEAQITLIEYLLVSPYYTCKYIDMYAYLKTFYNENPDHDLVFGVSLDLFLSDLRDKEYIKQCLAISLNMRYIKVANLASICEYLAELKQQRSSM